jgi:FkbH-like protein
MSNKKSTEDISNLEGVLSQWRDNPPYHTTMGRLFDTDDINRVMALLRVWQAGNLDNSENWPASQRVNIAICGFTTLNYMKPYLRWAALADGAVPKVTVGSYNQLFQDLSNPDSPVIDETVEILWIWAELSDLISTNVMVKPAKLISETGLDAVDEAVDSLVSALSLARKKFKGFLLVNDFVPMRRSPFGIAEANRDISFEQVYRHANDRLVKGLSGISYTGIFSLSHHIRRFGLAHAVDPRLRLMADCLFTPDFFFEVARGIRPYLRALKGNIRKVLVLDLDNTLWAGVVGEDGWDKVKIGTDPLGKAFASFQSAILELYERGVILAINSKNNPNDVEEIFARREEMLLKLDHFASVQVNWQDKATNCKNIAEDINVGLDSLVFWDDNPAERLLVRESLEDLYVVEPPSDPARWADFLRNLDLFDALQLSDEDARRGRMYAENRRRRDMASTSSDLKSFLANLHLKVSCRPACQENIPRIVSLLMRTNQFNLTTKRHSEQNVREWAHDSYYKIMSYSAQDRFGSYGIVGVTILKCLSDCAEIDSFLLSCRALGKGIEDVMLAVIAEQANQAGLTKLTGTYIPTKKNAPIKDFLPCKDFLRDNQSDQGIEYSFDLKNQNLMVPEHVTIEVLDN